jgi:phospholipid N-methyltransferase
MGDFTLFLGKFLRHGTAIASVAPSSRWLSRLAVCNIDWASAATLVELGGGTGPITQAIAERVRPGCRVVVIERDPDFAWLLGQRFGNLTNFEIVQGDVCDLMAILFDRDIASVDHIISGLPVPSFPRSLQESLFRAVGTMLRPEGSYNQITEIPWLYQNLYRRHFEDVRFVFEPRNVPPAGAYFCRSPRRVGEARPRDLTRSASTGVAPAAQPRSSGTSPGRRLVNLGFRLAGARRRGSLERMSPVRIQQQVLSRLVSRARGTRFGRDHRFGQVRSVPDFQDAVPIRTYESLWADYLRDCYPIFDNLTWPGRIPYIALSSGTTQGPSKFIPVSSEMIRSNQKAARTMLAWHQAANPRSKLFHGRLCVLGGSTDLATVAPGVLEGDLSGIAAIELPRLLRPYSFPPLELALEPDWDRKLSLMAEAACRERITLVSGVPSWLRVFFERVLSSTGMATIADVWPDLELVVHGGVKFDPYRESFRSLVGSDAVLFQEVYPCSEGFIGYGDPTTGLLRLAFDHGIFYEFVPLEHLDSPHPVRHWLGTAETGVNYAIVVSTAAGMWGHLIGDTIRFETLDPPLFTFTGRTRYSLSAFGEHLISEEVESAIAVALAESASVVSDWHLGPVFSAPTGYHLLVIEFVSEPADLPRFRAAFDQHLADHNADYRAHRSKGAGFRAPAVVVASPGSFEAWMRDKGKLGGQHKVPRMDSSGAVTGELRDFLRESARVARELPSDCGSCEQP